MIHRGPFQALAGRMEQILFDVDLVVKRAESLSEKAKTTSDDGYLDGVALNLHSFYAGIESCFEDIARTVDGGLPSGANWHQELLQQMTADMKGLRPPVISRETRDCLDEFRAFRHLVRNIYAFNLKPGRLQSMASTIRQCFDSSRQDLEAFIQFLRELDSK